MDKAKIGGKNRKVDRGKRKNAAKVNPLSLFVIDKISGEQYFKLVGKSR